MSTETTIQPEAGLEEIRTAITAFAPLLLPELEQEKDQAFARALACGSLGPMEDFLQEWRLVTDIECELVMPSPRGAELRPGLESKEGRQDPLELAALLLTAAAEFGYG